MLKVSKDRIFEKGFRIVYYTVTKYLIVKKIESIDIFVKIMSKMDDVGRYACDTCLA